MSWSFQSADVTNTTFRQPARIASQIAYSNSTSPPGPTGSSVFGRPNLAERPAARIASVSP